MFSARSISRTEAPVSFDSHAPRQGAKELLPTVRLTVHLSHSHSHSRVQPDSRTGVLVLPWLLENAAVPRSHNIRNGVDSWPVLWNVCARVRPVRRTTDSLADSI